MQTVCSVQAVKAAQHQITVNHHCIRCVYDEMHFLNIQRSNHNLDSYMSLLFMCKMFKTKLRHFDKTIIYF